MPSTPLPDPTRCPLCGASNACAVEIARASGTTPSTCWCMSAKFDETLRARVPIETRGMACICARCAADAQR